MKSSIKLQSASTLPGNQDQSFAVSKVTLHPDLTSNRNRKLNSPDSPKRRLSPSSKVTYIYIIKLSLSNNLLGYFFS
jgi:hypothetical protein